ncbi:MAG: aldehyde dehydrogenase family protein [Candidatus Adiutrix sp.]|jgi:succinate-semialdehyde dehydrogenase|nr:aldehyde dehydrogenase family protein [Candidatus Adiutrix sp.]
MDTAKYVEGLIARARIAQKEYEAFSQERVDACTRAAGKAVYDHAEELARLAVDETRMGRYEDKILKNKGKTKMTWLKLKGQKSRGIIRHIPELALVEVAKPIGVIGAVTPTTNPNMTPAHNAMMALKCGNAIIVCPHPRSTKSAIRTVELMREAVAKLGAPADLIQVVESPSVEASTLVMKMTDLCVSTGGPAMVRAAYSSGRPAFGVGPGNVQCLIDRGADIVDAAKKISAGRIYDNGILCSCEQSVICPAEKFDELMAEFVKNGAYQVKDQAEIDRLRAKSFPDGASCKDFVGAPALFIAKECGLGAPDDCLFLAVALERCGRDEPLAKEKLFPVLGVFKYHDWKEAVAIALANLEEDGKGHSCVIHSHDRANIEYAALTLPVSRFSINQTGSNSLGGTIANGLNPTATLGCGSWGGNSQSENLWFHHLMNVSRIVYPIEGAVMPSDEEIWAE